MIRRELGIFLIVGCLTVVVDFTCYRGLLSVSPAMVSQAKAFGFVTGTVFAYFANRFWTFGHHRHLHHSLWRFSVLYGFTLAVNVIVNAAILSALGHAFHALQTAFLIATGLSATLNFLGMKLFVFRSVGRQET